MTTIEGSDLFISCNTWPSRKIEKDTDNSAKLPISKEFGSYQNNERVYVPYYFLEPYQKRFSWKRRNFNNQTKNFPMIYPRIEDFAEKMSNACAVLSLFGRLHRLTLRKARWPPFNFAIFSVSWRILSAHFQDKRCSPQNQEKRLGFFGKIVRHNLF